MSHLRGIRQRHGNRCSRVGSCDCPWEAGVYNVIQGKKVRRTFATCDQAIAWREGAARLGGAKSLAHPGVLTAQAFARMAAEAVSDALGSSVSDDAHAALVHALDVAYTLEDMLSGAAVKASKLGHGEPGKGLCAVSGDAA